MGQTYFSAAIEACRLLNVRGVLLGASGQQIPRDLPPNLCHADYAPFSEVFSRAACVVHHGGLGTSAQAMRAGVPQLVMPLAYDQADNAARMRRLGVAKVLFPRRFHAAAVARHLMAILADDGITQSARKVAEMAKDGDGAAEASAILEELV
jgi:UDP:flavonoid glycosyltransferase YjiC (YdhE family)